MKLTATLTAAFLIMGSAVAFAQTSPDGATAGEKPGQGTNTGAIKDGMMMKDGKMVPKTKDGAMDGSSTGTGEAAMPAKPGMGPEKSNSGKGVPDTK